MPATRYAIGDLLFGKEVYRGREGQLDLVLLNDARARRHDCDPTPGGETLMSIEIRNVTKRFGFSLAVDDVSLEIPQGSLTAVLDPAARSERTAASKSR